MLVLSKSQIDLLGQQLKVNFSLEKDLDIERLDAYRLSFHEAMESVQKTLVNNGHNAFTQRPAKSTPSIIAKLIRQPNIRLSQIQDIAGLRFIVSDLRAQQDYIERLQILFEKFKIIDRRNVPSFGYRAMHLIIWVTNKPIEIQIRTLFQHLWAQSSEVLADSEGHELKYGGGNPKLKDALLEISDKIHSRETEILTRNAQLNESQIEQEFNTIFNAIFHAMLPIPNDV
jgi:putative GTP pyrophosphokinase